MYTIKEAVGELEKNRERSEWVGSAGGELRREGGISEGTEKFLSTYKEWNKKKRSLEGI